MTLPRIASLLAGLCIAGFLARGAAQKAATLSANAPAQDAAVKKFPALGVAGSTFNRAFLDRVKKARVEEPDVFADPGWPLHMAEEVARTLPDSAKLAPRAASSGMNLQGRIATAPADSPPAVQLAVTAGNALQTRGYKYGGGRATLEDWGYDCSGSVSYVLIKAGLLDEPRTSRTFASYGEPGPGRWITVYASPGHVFITLCGLRLDTGGRVGVGERGPRWNRQSRPAAGYTLRHPPGL